MQPNDVRPYQKWHWAGDQIAYDTIIPASRAVPGTRKRWYPIDIREYLTTQGNAVIRKAVREIVGELNKSDQAKFLSEAPGSFDFRADAVVEYTSRLEYRPLGRRFDQWLFPDETLAVQGGDCEDLAFLLAALLEATGISSYCIRVALGRVTHHDISGRVNRSDHAWVVYLNEAGAWEILEPLAISSKTHRRGRREKTKRELGAIEYTPYFVFNREHLWRVRGPHKHAGLELPQYLGTRRFWKEFRPLFAAKVHEGIFDEALVGMSASDLRTVKRTSLMVDVNVLSYDPRDHFDFAYIKEGWDLVKSRLKTGELRDFALAAHSIGDFYAHSFYADFANTDAAGNLIPYDPDRPNLKASPEYDFSGYQGLPGCSEGAAEAAASWRGELISGQWWRWFTTLPDELQNSKDFAHHRCLPDHDEVAVDDVIPKSQQRHYQKGSEYTTQFRQRRKAAIDHIRQVYQKWQPA
ncbi:MAG: hypothetical protein LAN70_16335 [Acidobacteriia bacterium]|nr:hypothetical protein [Terriglobia bacterium]